MMTDVLAVVTTPSGASVFTGQGEGDSALLFSVVTTPPGASVFAGQGEGDSALLFFDSAIEKAVEAVVLLSTPAGSSGSSGGGSVAGSEVTGLYTDAGLTLSTNNRLLGRSTEGSGGAQELSIGIGGLTFLATPSSANLRSFVTDETGSGALVFATSPSLVAADLGTPSAGTLTNCTGLPWSTGVTGKPNLGTAAALNVGTSAGSVVQLDGSSRLPAVDGSQLTNLPGGTVTSVGIVTPTGLTVSGSPVTTSGSITLAYSAGYVGFLSADKTKLDGIESGAKVNVNADWNAGSGDAQILNKPALGGAAALSVGTTAGTVAAGNDARLSDARTPTAHKASHAIGGADVLSPADIGAATAAQGSLADSAVQPGDALTDLSSGGAASGHVPVANGSGGISWGAQSGSGGGGIDPVISGMIF